MSDINNINIIDYIKLEDSEKDKIIDNKVTIDNLFKNYKKVIASSFHISADAIINKCLKKDETLSLESMMMIYSMVIDLYFKEDEIASKDKKEKIFITELIGMKTTYVVVNYDKEKDINEYLNFVKNCVKMAKDTNETDMISFSLPSLLNQMNKNTNERLNKAKEEGSKIDEKTALDLMNEIKKLKYDIIELGFFSEMKKYSYHTEEEIMNNKVSDADKLSYFKKMPMLSFIKVHMEEEIENYIHLWRKNQDFSDIIKYEENDNSITAFVDKNNVKSKHFANAFISLIKILEMNGIEQYQAEQLDNGIKMIFTMLSENNKDDEAKKFKEFIKEVSNIIIEEKLVYMTNEEIQDVTTNFNNSIREINLLSKLPNKDTVKKRNKI